MMHLPPDAKDVMFVLDHPDRTEGELQAVCNTLVSLYESGWFPTVEHMANFLLAYNSDYTLGVHYVQDVYDGLGVA